MLPRDVQRCRGWKVLLRRALEARSVPRLIRHRKLSRRRGTVEGHTSPRHKQGRPRKGLRPTRRHFRVDCADGIFRSQCHSRGRNLRTSHRRRTGRTFHSGFRSSRLPSLGAHTFRPLLWDFRMMGRLSRCRKQYQGSTGRTLLRTRHTHGSRVLPSSRPPLGWWSWQCILCDIEEACHRNCRAGPLRK